MTPTRRDLMAYQVVTGVRWEWLESGEGDVFVPGGPYQAGCARAFLVLAA